MRFVAIMVIGVLFALRADWCAAPTAGSPVSEAQDAVGAKGPQVEQILIPIYAKPRSRAEAPAGAYWGALSDGEVFREIRALSREGLVQNAGQPTPPVRILREFFAPSQDSLRDGFLGHYVFIVECTKSDLKHVTGAVTK
jgi:hypothetical protein